MDCSLLGSSVHGILQARILEWVAYPFSRGSYQPMNRLMNQTRVSCIADELFTSWATKEALDKSIWYAFPELLCKCKKLPLSNKRKMLTMWRLWWLSTESQASWSLRTDNVHPYDTLLPHHQPIRKLCTSWSQTFWPTSLTWLLKVLCQNPSGSSELFRAWTTCLLVWPCSKPFSAPNSILVCLASPCGAQELALR